MGSVWRKISVVAGGMLAALLALSLTGVALWRALHSERGSAWLLGHVPGVVASGTQGALLGDFDAAHLTIEQPAGGGRITLSRVRWRGLHIERSVEAGLWWRVQLAELHADRIDLPAAPSTGTAPSAPSDLQLPLEIEVASLTIGEIHMPALGAEPLRDLHLRAHLSAASGALHRVDDVRLAWGRLKAQGSAQIVTRSPLRIDAQVALTQSQQPQLAWSAQATLAGPLQQPQLRATVRALPRPGQREQSLDAQATLRPFDLWPLGDLQASTKSLDLSLFHNGAPLTALSGDASMRTTARDQPASLTLRLANAEAGLWNEGRLPLRSVSVELRGRPDQAQTLELPTFSAELGTQRQAGGQIQGRGQWTPQRWTLAASVNRLQPSLLDARAAAVPLSGPISVEGSGTNVEVKADLSGQIAAQPAPRPVQFKFDASLGAQRIELRDAQLASGDARAALSGLATRAASDAPWQLKGRGALQRFDPLPWWPGNNDSPWRRGAHRLNASTEFELSLPLMKAEKSALEAISEARGQIGLEVTDSLLAGVPLSGTAHWRHTNTPSPAAALKLDAAGNTFQADLEADRGNIAVAAPALDRLAPLWQLAQPPRANATLAGALKASGRVSGRWPHIATDGDVDATALHINGNTVQHAQAHWQLDTASSGAVDVQATLSQLALSQSTFKGSPPIDSAQLSLSGTAHEHRLVLRAESKAQPPAWTDSMRTAARTGAGTLAQFKAQGSLFDAAGGVAGWRGTLQQIELGDQRPDAPPWLRASDLGLELQWAGGAPRASLQPGRAEVLGGALRWSQLRWQGAWGQQPAQVEAHAELEPITVAPLLARMQPEFGWGGDLAVSGHIDLHSAPSFSADVVLERHHGDLSVTDELGTQALGLTDLRAALNARDGVWNFTHAFAGNTLGVAAGAVVARTSPQAPWPPADTPIQGVLEVRVANLGIWGRWVPPGWRLSGALRTSASLGGRITAPEFTGEMRGSGLGLRNFLQGVNVTDGEVAIQLHGTEAHIERFTARAGAGSAQLEGRATLGESPQAQLKLTAQQFQLLGRVDRRIVTSGQAELRLSQDTLALNGQFGVDEGLFDFTRSDAPGLSRDVEVLRAQPAEAVDGEVATVPEAAGRPVALDMALDLRVALGERLRVRGRGIDAGLRGELHITSPEGRLAVNGSVRAVDGTYAAYGQKLTIDRGVFSFNGPLESPRLDIEATRPNTDVRVGVIVAGNAQAPRIRLFSEPDMSDTDKLSWLVLGRASDGLGRTDTALLQRAALALLAGDGESRTDQIVKTLGLDELSLRQTEGEVRETVVSLGRQLSRRWYVGYERGLNATTGTWQLIYRVARRFTLRAQSGLDNSLDVIWSWRWQ